MSSQGPNSGGTFVDDAAVGTIAWTSPGNAAASDDSKAIATTSFGGGTTHYLRATNFGFTIPTGAPILGIVVGLERRQSSASDAVDSSVRLYSGGAFIGNNKATSTTWPTTDAYEDHGGSTDMWGTSLTAADINNAGFGVGISSVSTGPFIGMEIDHIRITVYYQATKDLAVGLTLTPTLVKQAGKVLVISETVTLAVTKQVGKFLTPGATFTLAVGKSISKALSIGVTATPALLKRVGKSMTTGVTFDVVNLRTFIPRVLEMVVRKLGSNESPYRLGPATRRRDRRI